MKVLLLKESKIIFLKDQEDYIIVFLGNTQFFA